MNGIKVLIGVLGVVAWVSMSASALAQARVSHTHIGHVMSGWTDTPGGAGLLPTAEAEAEIALQHATLASQRPENMTWMRWHIGHVLHAIDPDYEPTGPGKGYGLIRAAMGAAKHVNFAAQAGDASDAVKLHAVHVATSAGNAAARGERIISLSRRVMRATHPTEAYQSVKAVLDQCRMILNGFDANGDGNVTWKKGEGGLKQARQHMGFMMKAEGLQ